MQDQLFFRVRKNGIAVFRVREDEVTHRLEMIQIAVIKEKTGEIKPHQRHSLAHNELSEIEHWMERRSQTPAGELDRFADQINLAAQYIQADASDAEIDAAQHRLLMSVHDLRSNLVRRLGKTKPKF